MRRGSFSALLAIGFLFLFASAIQATTFTVNSTNDPGDGVCSATECTLREAINAANANPGKDTIAFNIPGAGPHTIRPTSALPEITDPVIIDGYTQPGASPNTNPVGQVINAIIKIELEGSLISSLASGLTIVAGSSNVRGLAINRFTSVGIDVRENGSNVIEGNFIGTDINGQLRFSNAHGIQILSDNNTIGGAAPNARNLISGHYGEGVFINGSGNTVQGNYIGTDVTGHSELYNGWRGIVLAGFGHLANSIGGAANGAGNIIAFNQQGVAIQTAGSGGSTGVSISANFIFSNRGLGIDLYSEYHFPDVSGVDPNDLGDTDTGPNNLQNFPELASATSSGGSTTIQGTLNSNANRTFRIEFFANTECDPSGYGEGERFIGFTNVTTDGNGDASFNVTLPVDVTVGQFITSTATDPDGNTSEFSACLGVTTPNIAPDTAFTSPPPVTVKAMGYIDETNAAVNQTVGTQLFIRTKFILDKPEDDEPLIFKWTGSDQETPTSDLLYSYRLKWYNGNWDEWSAPSPATSKTYESLPLGSYVFEVRAHDADGNIDPTPLSHEFTVVVNYPTQNLFTIYKQPPPKKKQRGTNSNLKNCTSPKDYQGPEAFMYCPGSSYNGKPIEFIVIHTMEGWLGHSVFKFQRGGDGTHFYISRTGHIVQAAETTKRVDHAGTIAFPIDKNGRTIDQECNNKNNCNYSNVTNQNSIGIEHEGFHTNDPKAEAMLEASASLIRNSLVALLPPGTTLDNEVIVAHAAILPTKSDPGKWDWRRFFELIGGVYRPPNPPDQLTGSFPSRGTRGQVTLKWRDRSNSEDGFIIERLDPGASWREISRTGPVIGRNIMKFTDRNVLDLRQRYCYRIKAFNSAGPNSDGEAPVWCTRNSSSTSLLPLEVWNISSPMFTSGSLHLVAEGQGISAIQLSVLDLSGRKVFDSGKMEGNTLIWNLQNNKRQPLANGVYLYVVRVRGHNGREYVSEVRKLVIVR